MVAMLSQLAALALATLSVASPTHKQPKTCPNVQRNANFDNLGGIPGNMLNPIPTPYMGLYYQGFTYATIVQTNLAPGVIPHSGQSYAVSGTIQQAQGTPMLTTNFPNSQTQSFDLQNFYFGCVLNLGQGAAAVPSQCNVQVTGYRGSDNSVSNAKQVCSQQFQYNPSTALGVQQQAFSGAVKGCKDIQFAIVTYSLPGGQAALNPTLSLLLDDVKYTTKAKKC